MAHDWNLIEYTDFDHSNLIFELLPPNLKVNFNIIINRFHKFWVNIILKKKHHNKFFEGDVSCPHRVMAMIFIFTCEQNDLGLDADAFHQLVSELGKMNIHIKIEQMTKKLS